MDKKEPKEIEKYHGYYIEQIVGNNFIHVMITFHKSNLYIESNEKKIRINYSDIIWCEEQDVLALGRTKMVICTKTNEVFEFLVSKDVKFIEFIQSNIHPAKERPAIVTVDMETMPDEKIRRQYFNGPIYVLSSILIPLYIFLFTTELASGQNLLKTLGEIIMSLWIPIVWLTPLAILSFINRYHFGEIICILNKDGLQHKQGFIPWNQITSIEYEIVLPRRIYSLSNRIHSCYARIHVKDSKDLLLVRAPYLLLKRARQYNPDIKGCFTKHSINTIRFFIIISALFFLLSFTGITIK